MSTFPRGTLGGSHQLVKCVLLTIGLAGDHLTPEPGHTRLQGPIPTLNDLQICLVVAPSAALLLAVKYPRSWAPFCR